ncbi:hypothetical protein HZC09_02110 [Candidatus Micrarchaeota archaeon]|nr:hypothetical protein [Candidatus Micrarchaeota archaeon]
MAETEYSLGEPEDFQSKFSSMLEPVKKFGIGKLLFLLMILAVAAWFFILSPKPGTVLVEVSETDGGPLDGILVFLSISGEKNPKEDVTSSDGTVVFKNVPSDRELSIDVETPDGYESPRIDSFKLKSKSETKLVTLSKKSSIEVSQVQPSVYLGTGCSTSVPVKVDNKGAEAAQVQFVGEGDLAGRVEGTATIPPLTFDNIPVNVTAWYEKKDMSGNIRVKGTGNSVKLTVSVGEPVEADVSPSSISDNVKPGEQLKTLITVSNRGREGELRDLGVKVTGDIEQYTDASFTDIAPLKPEEEKILTVVINVPSVGEGKLVGVIMISTSCKTYPVPVELDVRAD